MPRVLSLAVAAISVIALVPVAALAHEGNPNFESLVDAVTPPTEGVKVSVVNRDDRFLLQNLPRQTVMVRGYEDEPYARLRAGGRVEVNTNSPAYYLNEDRFARVSTPAGVTSKSPPKWKAIDRSGRFEWHDHRMHYMAEGRRPPQVTDPDVRTKVFDYRVPIRVGDRDGAIAGTLYWTPLPGGGLPVGAILAFAGIVIAICVVVIVVRRRAGPGGHGKLAEAW